MFIFHITNKKDWQAAQKSGAYIPANFEKDGFIHCSYKEQVIQTANRYFAGASDLVLLKINPLCLDSKVVEENLEGGKELFPHLYGILPLTAVVDYADLPFTDSTGFSFPERLK